MDDTTYKKILWDKVSKVKDSKKNVNLRTLQSLMTSNYFYNSKELGIETKVVLFPVNGKWYDHLGVNKETRGKYYSKMKSIIESYGVSTWIYLLRNMNKIICMMEFIQAGNLD